MHTTYEFKGKKKGLELALKGRNHKLSLDNNIELLPVATIHNRELCQFLHRKLRIKSLLSTLRNMWGISLETGLQQSDIQLYLTLKYNPKNCSNGEESNDETFF